MKWLNFIPLLVWMLGILPSMALNERLRGEMEPETVDAIARFFALGTLLWLVIGGVLCL